MSNYRPIKLDGGCFSVKPTSHLVHKFLKLRDLNIVYQAFGPVSLAISHFIILLVSYFFAYDQGFLPISPSIFPLAQLPPYIELATFFALGKGMQMEKNIDNDDKFCSKLMTMNLRQSLCAKIYEP